VGIVVVTKMTWNEEMFGTARIMKNLWMNNSSKCNFTYILIEMEDTKVSPQIEDISKTTQRTLTKKQIYFGVHFYKIFKFQPNRSISS